MLKTTKTIMFAMMIIALFLIGCTEVNIGEEDPDRTNGASGFVVYESNPEVVYIYEQEDSGRAMFTITDALVNMDSINELWVTVDEVEVQTQSEGWVTVSSQEHRYDLLQLREDDEQGILADVSLAPGTYQQLRLHVSDVEVIDSEGAHEVVVPSNILRFTAPFTVEADSLTVVEFDFQIDDSLHLTGNGRYVLVPVVQVVRYSDADVRVSSRQRVIVEGGTPSLTTTVRSDTQGDVREDNIMIPRDITITIQDGAQERIIIQNRTETRTVINNTVVVDRDQDRDQGRNRTTARSNTTINASVNVSG